MSQPVKLSDALVLDARIAAQAQQRSIAGQVEFWASLGKSVELLLNGSQIMHLRRGNLDSTPDPKSAQSLGELIDLVGTPEGNARIKKNLDAEPFPHFEAHPAQAGLFIRTEANGAKTIGKFIGRVWTVVPAKAASVRVDPAPEKSKPRRQKVAVA
jgi:hypothetical protein